LTLRLRLALAKRKTLKWGIALGAVLLLLGVWAGYSGGCFGNFAFGGVSCYLWGFPLPEAVLYAIFYGLVSAGILLIFVSILVRYTNA